MKQRAGAIEREKKRKSGDRKQKGETRFSRQVVGEDGCRIEVLGILDSWEGGRDTWPRWMQACIGSTYYVKPAQVLSAHKSAGEVPAGAGWGKGSGSGLSGGFGAGAAAGAGLMFSGRSPLKGRWRWVAEAAGRCRYAALIFSI